MKACLLSDLKNDTDKLIFDYLMRLNFVIDLRSSDLSSADIIFFDLYYPLSNDLIKSLNDNIKKVVCIKTNKKMKNYLEIYDKMPTINPVIFSQEENDHVYDVCLNNRDIENSIPFEDKSNDPIIFGKMTELKKFFDLDKIEKCDDYSEIDKHKFILSEDDNVINYAANCRMHNVNSAFKTKQLSRMLSIG